MALNKGFWHNVALWSAFALGAYLCFKLFEKWTNQRVAISENNEMAKIAHEIDDRILTNKSDKPASIIAQFSFAVGIPIIIWSIISNIVWELLLLLFNIVYGLF